MLELGQILGLFAAVVLVSAITAWAKLAWRPTPDDLVHGRLVANPAPAEFASQILVLALGLSAFAAIFAVVGWIGL